MYIPKLSTQYNFPSPHDATEEGIVAIGGDLSPNRILKAYREGIFPWFATGDPIIWWSPTPRLILELNDFKLRKSLKKRMNHFTFKFDTAFEEVLQACASAPRKGQNGTWLQENMIEAYTTLHHMGYAHSIESYHDNKLVGGLYGVVVGKVFCGESMFAIKSDASKAAFAFLIEFLKKHNFEFIDCQVPTDHLKSLGAKEVSREDFLEKLLPNVHCSVENVLWR
jgi:leucyl/phenylalanyl-tRNA--protein transferase